MHPWVAAAWGLTGGLCVEALALHSYIRSTRRWDWRRPIPQGMAAFFVSVVIRVGAGAGLAAAAAGSGQVAGSLAAFGLGVAAPLVVEKLAQAVPLASSPIASTRDHESLGQISANTDDSLVGLTQEARRPPGSNSQGLDTDGVGNAS
jgi:hypothetical protein